jgi:hypothetical protein
MKAKYIIISFLSTALFASCTDVSTKLYDSVPSEDFPSSSIQYTIMSQGAYERLKALCNYGWEWLGAQEMASGEMILPTRAADWSDDGVYVELHKHNWNSSDNITSGGNFFFSGIWNGMYQGIKNCSKVIELLQSTNSTESVQTVAQMRILRGYYYWILLDSFGDVPLDTLYSNAVENPKRATKLKVYHFIESEVLNNVGKVTSNYKTTVNKYMAYTLLAKLYLNAKTYTGTTQWAKTEQYCDSVKAGSYSLETDPLGAFVTNNSSSSENIFTVPFDETNNTGLNLHEVTLHYDQQSQFGSSVSFWNGIAASYDAFLMFDNSDKRKAIFLYGLQYNKQTGEKVKDSQLSSDDNFVQLNLNPYIPALVMGSSNTTAEIKNSGARVEKYEYKYGILYNASNDFVLMRLADVLLMRSEARIMQGKSGDEDLNMVRNRAGLSSITGATLADLQTERTKEMFAEGTHRQDMIRWGTYGDAQWEKTVDTSDKTFFPIPRSIQNSNPNITASPE